MNARKSRSNRTVKAGATAKFKVKSPPLATPNFQKSPPAAGHRRAGRALAAASGGAGPRKYSSERPAVKPARKVPPILLEGDKPVGPKQISKPPQKPALEPAPPVEVPVVREEELPATYGTGKLRLAARDPHWVYAHWDLASEQQRQLNELSAHRHLVVRVGHETAPAGPFVEAHVQPESRHWFVYVKDAGERYVAELGYYAADGQWKGIAASNPAATPADAPARDTTARFVTIPPDMPLSGLAEGGRQAAPQAEMAPVPGAPSPSPNHKPAQETTTPPDSLLKSTPGEGAWPAGSLAGEGQPAGRVPSGGGLEGFQEPPKPSAPPQPLPPLTTFAEWTPERVQALAEWIAPDRSRPAPANSLVIAEWLGGHIQAEIPAMEALPPGLPAEGIIQVSSPLGGQESAPKGFWFNVNAELVIYGSTEPDARVTIGGRAIQLRPDGSFSFRFALPDGQYELPITAVSAQGDTRQAKLEFYRGTRSEGAESAPPRDPALKPPAAENVETRQGMPPD